MLPAHLTEATSLCGAIFSVVTLLYMPSKWKVCHIAAFSFHLHWFSIFILYDGMDSRERAVYAVYKIDC